MTEDKQIVSGIDIGTTKIAVVIAEWLKNEKTINILGVGESPSYGLKKGIVVNMNQLKLKFLPQFDRRRPNSLA